MGVVVGLAGLVVSAVVAGEFLRTPEQAAAEAAPPDPSPVTVAAERRVLTEPVVLRGSVKPGPSVKLMPPSGTAGPDAVVTGVAIRKGQRLYEGAVLIEVRGQPIFALVLPFPLYRDIVGGAEGPDVRQVQRTLRRLGYFVRDSGRVDSATQQALSAFYRDRGYHAPPSSPEAVAALARALAAVTEAQAAYDNAESSGSDTAVAKAALDDAKSTLAQARLAAGPSLPQASVALLGRAGGTVTSVGVQVGAVIATADAPLVELDGAAPYIMASATADQARLLVKGQQATVYDDVTGVRTHAKVVSVGHDVDSTNGQPGYPVQLAFDENPMAPTDDRTVRVDIAVDQAAEAVLAVPVTAIYSRADGTTFVSVVKGDDRVEDVSVTAGRAAGGWVEVSPVPEDALAPGDLVVVGEGSAASDGG